MKGSVEGVFEGVSEVSLLVGKGSDLSFIPVAPKVEGQVYMPYVRMYEDIQESKSQVFDYVAYEDIFDSWDGIGRSIASDELNAEESIKPEVSMPISYAYPNPSVNGKFYLELPEESSFVKVYDAQRAVVYENQNRVEQGGVVNIVLVKSGIYYLQVYTEGGMYTQKLQVR